VKQLLLHRPLLLTLLGVVLGIQLEWFWYGFLGCFLAILWLKFRPMTALAIGLALGSSSYQFSHRTELKQPSTFTGKIEVRSFPEFFQGYTIVDVRCEKGRSKLRIAGRHSLAPGDVVEVISQNPGERSASISAKQYHITETGFLRHVSDLRLALLDRMDTVYGPEISPWVQSLTLNFPSDLAKGEKQALILSGTYHLVSASGLHVVILSVFLLQILISLRIERHYSIWVIFGLLILYCGLTGFHPPTVRASLMWLASAHAYLFRRSYDGLSALSLSCLVWLLFSPESLQEPGFQLSYLVTAFLILWYEKIGTHISTWLQTIQGSLVAFLAAEPISMWWFGRLVFAGILTNLLVEIPSSTVLIGGFLGIIPIVGMPFAWVASHLVTYMKMVTTWTASFPSFSTLRQSTPVWLWIAYYVLLLIVISQLKLASKKKPSRP
jgi:ComEC/Rec2-related protein